MGEEGDYNYTYRYTVTTRMTPALRSAAMRAILMFQITVRDKVTRQRPQTSTFEEKGEPKRLLNRGPSALPLGQTGSQRCTSWTNPVLRRLVQWRRVTIPDRNKLSYDTHTIRTYSLCSNNRFLSCFKKDVYAENSRVVVLSPTNCRSLLNLFSAV